MINWEKALKNTTSKIFDTPGGKEYLRTCKTCNDVVKNNPTTHRQILGNCMQQITICKECKNTFVLDSYQNYNYFLDRVQNKDN